MNTTASANMAAVVEPGSRAGSDFFLIHPAAIPSGSQLLLDVFRGNLPQGPGKQMAAFGVRSAPGARTKNPLTVSTRMDIVYITGNCQ